MLYRFIAFAVLCDRPLTVGIKLRDQRCHKDHSRIHRRSLELDMAVGQNPGTPVNIPKAFKIDSSLGGPSHPQKGTRKSVLTHCHI